MQFTAQCVNADWRSLLFQFVLQQPQQQQGQYTSRNMAVNMAGSPDIHRAQADVGFHDPEARFNLIQAVVHRGDFLARFQYPFPLVIRLFDFCSCSLLCFVFLLVSLFSPFNAVLVINDSSKPAERLALCQSTFVNAGDHLLLFLGVGGGDACPSRLSCFKFLPASSADQISPDLKQFFIAALTFFAPGQNQ